MSNYFTVWGNKGTFLLIYFFYPMVVATSIVKKKVPKVINDLKDP